MLATTVGTYYVSGSVLNNLVISHLIYILNLSDRHYFHFTDEKIES